MCMAAFKAVLDAAEEEGVVHFFIEVALEARTRSLGPLKQEWHTHDYRFAHEPYGPKADAYIRATERLVGKNPHTAARVIAIAPISPRETGLATVAWRDVCTLAAEAFGKLGHDEAAATSCRQQTRGRNGWNRWRRTRSGWLSCT